MVSLRLERVSKHFGDKTAVNQVEFDVGEGEIFGLLGANGAGKTTTMRMVLGLIYPDEGRILWEGEGYSLKVKHLMGYLPEERGLYPKVKVHEQINYLAELRGCRRKDTDRELKYWLERFEIPQYYNKKVEELSKGNQQKVQFIAAVIHKPRILILDEAFSGLDPVNVELLKGTVRELSKNGTSILFSSHRMDHVEELCQNICILHRSNTVIKGNLREIKRLYPREKVRLETETPLERIEAIPGVRTVISHEAGYEITVDNPVTANEVLQEAMRQSTVHRFQIMEPTLNEIFIKLVGERHE